MRLCTYTMYIMVVIWIIHDYNKLQLSYTQVCDLFLSNFGETIIQPGRIKNNKCVPQGGPFRNFGGKCATL